MTALCFREHINGAAGQFLQGRPVKSVRNLIQGQVEMVKPKVMASIRSPLGVR